MSNATIFGLGVFVTLLLAAGLFFTVLEFRDIDRHPEQHEPESFRRKSPPGSGINPYQDHAGASAIGASKV